MINDLKKNDCTGCLACIAICPCNALIKAEDGEGFVYPRLNANSCISCGKCQAVCPALKTTERDNFKDHEDISYYAGQLVDTDLLTEVSSGGAFWALTVAVINDGGVVYGAVQENVDVIVHKRADNLDDAKSFRRSKYFQSDISDCFQQVKEDLSTGQTVLFSGTGCQIAGLKGFLQKDYSNLFTCDVVCHGVPSMMVWRKYREEKETESKKKIVGLIFRDKSKGWSQNQYKITFDDGSIEYERSTTQKFHAGYLAGLFYRPSCGSCRYACLPRQGDITLADFWKYSGELKTNKPDYGVSLIVVNNGNGKHLLDKASGYLYLDEVTENDALESCKHLHSHPEENPNREAFFELFNQKGYYQAAEKFLKPSILGKSKKLGNKLKSKIKGHNNGNGD